MRHKIYIENELLDRWSALTVASSRIYLLEFSDFKLLAKQRLRLNLQVAQSGFTLGVLTLSLMQVYLELRNINLLFQLTYASQEQAL